MNNLAGQNLLVTCTKTKSAPPVGSLTTAGNLYFGSKMFRHLVELTDIHGLKIYIRSARYGFLTMETIIEVYDERLAGSPKGKYPKGTGFWFGAEDYFSDAPKEYQRLLPPMPYGRAEGALLWLKKDFDCRKSFFAGNPPPSMKDLIIEFFSADYRSVDGCNKMLQETLGDYREYGKAIRGILSDPYKHRGYTKRVLPSGPTWLVKD